LNRNNLAIAVLSRDLPILRILSLGVNSFALLQRAIHGTAKDLAKRHAQLGANLRTLPRRHFMFLADTFQANSVVASLREKCQAELYNPLGLTKVPS